MVKALDWDAEDLGSSPTSVILGKSFTLSRPQLLLCKMGLTVLPVSVLAI